LYVFRVWLLTFVTWGGATYDERVDMASAEREVELERSCGTLNRGYMCNLLHAICCMQFIACNYNYIAPVDRPALK